MFADDTAMWTTEETLEACRQKLQAAVDRLQLYCKKRRQNEPWQNRIRLIYVLQLEKEQGKVLHSSSRQADPTRGECSIPGGAT